jgi:hypothetical protein
MFAQDDKACEGGPREARPTWIKLAQGDGSTATLSCALGHYAIPPFATERAKDGQLSARAGSPPVGIDENLLKAGYFHNVVRFTSLQTMATEFVVY